MAAKRLLNLKMYIKRSLMRLCARPYDLYKRVKAGYVNLTRNKYLRDHVQDAGKEILVFGDSQIAYWDLHRYFGELPMRSMGLSGECIRDALSRFKSEVLSRPAKAVIILSGTNDIADGRRAGDIADDISKIIDWSIDAHIKPVVCSVLPVRGVHKEHHPVEALLCLNKLIGTAAKEHSIRYVDFWLSMVDPEGELREGLTYDGLHPNHQGYLVMTSILKSAIKDLP